MDEGYIKFKADWKKKAPIDSSKIQDLIDYRNELYHLGLIGQYPDGLIQLRAHSTALRYGGIG